MKKKRGLRMANGGMVQGPGGPTDDLVPAHLSRGEAVLPAQTVGAMGGPHAVEDLIEDTTGQRPARGLRAGGRYRRGAVDIDFEHLDKVRAAEKAATAEGLGQRRAAEATQQAAADARAAETRAKVDAEIESRRPQGQPQAQAPKPEPKAPGRMARVGRAVGGLAGRGLGAMAAIEGAGGMVREGATPENILQTGAGVAGAGLGARVMAHPAIAGVASLLHSKDAGDSNEDRYFEGLRSKQAAGLEWAGEPEILPYGRLGANPQSVEPSAEELRMGEANYENMLRESAESGVREGVASPQAQTTEEQTSARSVEQGGLRASIEQHPDMPGMNIERDAEGRIIGYSGGRPAAQSDQQPPQGLGAGQAPMHPYATQGWDLAANNERMARVNETQRQMQNIRDGRDPNWRQDLSSGTGGGLGFEREQLMERIMTPHKGAQNGQLTIGQMREARGLLQDSQNEALKAAEIGARAQGGGGAGGGATGEPSLRDQIAMANLERNLSKDQRDAQFREQRAQAQDYKDLHKMSQADQKQFDSRVDSILKNYAGEDPQAMAMMQNYASHMMQKGLSPDEFVRDLDTALNMEKLIEGGSGLLGSSFFGTKWDGRPTQYVLPDGDGFVTDRGAKISRSKLNSWPKHVQEMFKSLLPKDS